jgi:hypothetical protein
MPRILFISFILKRRRTVADVTNKNPLFFIRALSYSLSTKSFCCSFRGPFSSSERVGGRAGHSKRKKYVKGQRTDPTIASSLSAASSFYSKKPPSTFGNTDAMSINIVETLLPFGPYHRLDILVMGFIIKGAEAPMMIDAGVSKCKNESQSPMTTRSIPKTTEIFTPCFSISQAEGKYRKNRQSMSKYLKML